MASQPQRKTLSQSFAEFNPVIEGLRPEPIDYRSYLAEFHQEYQRSPTLREVLEYSYQLREQLHHQYDMAIEQLSRTRDPRIDDFVEELKLTRDRLPRFANLDELEQTLPINSGQNTGQTIHTIDSEIPVVTRDGDLLFDEDYYRFIADRTGLSNYIGEYGELYAHFHLAGEVIAKSVKVNLSLDQSTNVYITDLSRRLNLLKSNLETMDIDQIRALIDQHTLDDTGLLRLVKERIETTPESELELNSLREGIIQAISNKEIDFVFMSPQRKVTWAEVKAYHKDFTREKLLENRGKKKSIYEQLIEHKSVAHLLGLEGQVGFVFISPLSKVDRGARELLSSIGYSVLEP